MTKHPYVLYADDDCDDQEIFKEMVQKIEGPISTVLFNEGTPLLLFLNSIATNDRLPKLVVLDINMPGTDGFTALAHIRDNPRFHELPVIMYTTSSNTADEKRCLQLGANEFITKAIFSNEFESFKNILLKYIRD